MGIVYGEVFSPVLKSLCENNFIIPEIKNILNFWMSL